MFKSFRSKLIVTSIVPMLLLVLIIGLTIVSVVDHFYLEQIEAQLTNEARLIAEQTNPSEYTQRSSILANIASGAARNSNSRVTIIAADGTVLADSDQDPGVMTNHASRPEVHAALMDTVGSITRQSSTLGMRMKYVAVPVKADSKVVGVVRLALPLKSIDMLLHRIWLIILVIMGLAAVATAFLAYRMASKLAEPLTDLTDVAESIAGGNLKGRVYYGNEDEIGTLATAMNTMAQRLEEKIGELSETKAQLESIMENTINGIVLMGKDNRILFINHRACELFTVEESMALHRHQIEITHSYAINDTIEQAIREKQAVHTECALHFIDDRIVQVYIVPVMSEAGTIECLLMVLNDISELKRLETVRKDFVANVSHELRTPMASISGFAETLMHENADNPTVLEFSRIIYEEANRLSRLANSLLELSRIEAADPGLKLTRFNIFDVITDVVAKMEQQLKNKQIEVEIQLSSPQNEIEADRDRIAQVLINILDNAITHSPKQGQIIISLISTVNELKVTITDEGPGIPPGEEKRIFERFYRVDKSRSRKDGGTGLGLSIAKHIIEVHHGSIGVDNTYPQRTTFYFTLPMK